MQPLSLHVGVFLARVCTGLVHAATTAVKLHVYHLAVPKKPLFIAVIHHL